jgi:hypothetical protein
MIACLGRKTLRISGYGDDKFSKPHRLYMTIQLIMKVAMYLHITHALLFSALRRFLFLSFAAGMEWTCWTPFTDLRTRGGDANGYMNFKERDRVAGITKQRTDRKYVRKTLSEGKEFPDMAWVLRKLIPRFNNKN